MKTALIAFGFIAAVGLVAWQLNRFFNESDHSDGLDDEVGGK